MALIPAEMATHYQLQLHRPDVPALAQLSSLDMQMKSILESKEMTDEMKFKKYYSTLRQYEEMRQDKSETVPMVVEKAAVPENVLPVAEHELLEAVPKAQQRGTKILLKYVQENPDLQWNEQKELVYKGTRIPNSNIISLVSDISRNRKNAVLPSGWKEFASALADQNIPIEAIGNKQRWAFMNRPPSDESSQYITEEDSFVGTPQNRSTPMSLKSLGSLDSTPKSKALKKKKVQTGKGKWQIWENLY